MDTKINERLGLVPWPIAEYRKELCGNCNCGSDPDIPCAMCPLGKWGPIFCSELTNISPPNIKTMAKSATRSAINWAKSMFKKTEKNEFQKRLSTCKKCEFWDSCSFGGTGRCMKCGCSTWIKLKMATEKCPIGKW